MDSALPAVDDDFVDEGANETLPLIHRPGIEHVLQSGHVVRGLTRQRLKVPPDDSSRARGDSESPKLEFHRLGFLSDVPQRIAQERQVFGGHVRAAVRAAVNDLGA